MQKYNKTTPCQRFLLTFTPIKLRKSMRLKVSILKENIRLALGSIRKNLLRSVLTILIIAFGITALVGILTSIESIKQTLRSEFSQMGANTFTIRDRSMFVFGSIEQRRASPITFRQAIDFKNRFQHNSIISVYVDGGHMNIVRHKQNETNPNIAMVGCDDNYFLTTGYNIDQGRVFSAMEIEAGANVAIIGGGLADQIFTDEDRHVNSTISVGNLKYRVVGILQKKGSSMGFSEDNNIFVPLNNIRRYLSGNNSYHINVMTDDAVSLSGTISEATSLFRNIRRLDPAEENNFSIVQSDNLSQILFDNISTVTLAATLIGLITLFGAAIGLMNIMLVSVKERTREIGIRKSVGATKLMIRNQFLTEAIVIGLIGGLTGIFGGILVGNIVTLITGGKFLIPWGWILLGIVLCIGTGLISGLYPAGKASELDPVESLRYE